MGEKIHMKKIQVLAFAICASATAFLNLPCDALGQSPEEQSVSKTANRFWQERKWAEAAGAYEALTKLEPANAQAWFRLGSSLMSMNKFDEAVGPLERAAGVSKGPLMYYTLGSVYSRLNNKEKSFENLTKAASTGFAQLDRLKADPNLEGIRGDDRFRAILESVDRNARPCKYSSEAKQFDFWIGEWDAHVNGQVVGTNVIQSLEDGCLIMENWAGGGGSTGKSMNFYNPLIKKWRQTYMSNGQAIWEMAGEYKDGVMSFEGEVISASGKILTRVNFYSISPDKVRHTQENSTDGGTTWTNVWDAMYVRKKAPVSR